MSQRPGHGRQRPPVRRPTSKLHRVDVFNSKHQLEAAFGADVLATPASIAIDTENRFFMWWTRRTT